MMRVLLFVALLALVARADEWDEHRKKNGYEVFHTTHKMRDIIWGRCNGWHPQLKGCVLDNHTMCDFRESPGPADADLEIVVGGLPQVFDAPTYVQWWAPRQSRTSYDALTSLEGAEVYPDMLAAYPHYMDDDFNGGNVRVGGEGEAVIRIRTPSTYKMQWETRLPLVHLRICGKGQTISVVLNRKDKIQFTPQGPIAKSECNSTEQQIFVRDSRRIRETTTTTTTQHPTTPAPAVRVTTASEAFESVDLDPVEFSRVYQCISDRQYYDQIAGDCTPACPEGTEASRGQCVKAQVNNSSAWTARFNMQVCGCDAECWADKEKSILHRMRLELAEHLDVPLHEVTSVTMDFDWKDHSHHAAVLRMDINSPRYTVEEGSMKLYRLFSCSIRAAEVMGMFVLRITEMIVNRAPQPTLAPPSAQSGLRGARSPAAAVVPQAPHLPEPVPITEEVEDAYAPYYKAALDLMLSAGGLAAPVFGEGEAALQDVLEEAKATAVDRGETAEDGHTLRV